MASSVPAIHWKLRVRGWLMTARVQTAAVTGAAPLWGALTVTPHLAGWQVGALFGLGLMAHVYGFILNEVVDRELDAAAPQLAGKPLVTGIVAPSSALVVALLQPILAVLLTFILFGSDVMLLTALLFSIGLATGYDLWGKHSPIPPLADAALGASVGLLVIYGALAASRWNAAGDDAPVTFSTALALATLSTLQIIFNNGVEGGLKDLKNDLAGRVNSTALWLGGRVQDGLLVAPRRLRRYAWALKWVSIAVGIAALLGCWSEIGCILGDRRGWLAAALLLALGMGLTLRRFLGNGMEYDRSRLKRLFSIHEFLTYAFAAAVAGPVVGMGWAAILIALPVVWFLLSNLALYGAPLEPRV